MLQIQGGNTQKNSGFRPSRILLEVSALLDPLYVKFSIVSTCSFPLLFRHQERPEADHQPPAGHAGQ